ncbi:MAG: glycosyltransferase family 2 protein [Mogibacterium sp.]|nr:glycosyltransferase family 2 protein [Mogibacterium sp.]
MIGSGLISVIVPVFNVRPYLAKALESVIRQTYSHLEIIVIDDGSTDGSGDICDEFAARDERIKVIHQENRGLSNARNNGLDIMNGEAVAFLDPDDSYHPDYIKAMAEAMDRENADIVVCKYTVHYSDKLTKHTKEETARPSIKAGVYGRDEALRALADGKINTAVWNKLYNSKLWDNIRFPDGHNYEDRDIVLRIFDRCRSVLILDQPLYYYLRRPGSITDTVSEANLKDISLARSHFEEYVSANTPAVFSFEQLKRVRQSTLSGMMANYIRYRGKRDELSSDFLDSLRAEIIEMGRDLGFKSMDMRKKAAYLMISKSPNLLKIAYPAYHAVRMLIYEATGR